MEYLIRRSLIAWCFSSADIVPKFVVLTRVVTDETFFGALNGKTISIFRI